MLRRGDRLAALEVERAKLADDDVLAAALADRGCAVPEELVLSSLVEDLRSRSVHGDRADKPDATRPMMSGTQHRMRS